jgi:predicted RNase H-like HicB family nuclease
MRKTVKELQFKVLIEQDEDGIYVASVPELQSCYTQGKTLEEVRKRIKEVIALVLVSEDRPLGSPYETLAI